MPSESVGDESVVHFYDRLAEDYHLIYADWWQAALGSSAVLAELLGSAGVAVGSKILDCSCGIGTQALGLAHHGYNVYGTDVSSKAIERARREAASRRLDVSFAVADMRDLRALGTDFDAVVSCDNSIPHLLSDVDLDGALRAIGSRLRRGGVFVASIRDYDAMVELRPSGTLPSVMEEPTGRRAAVQIWNWAPDRQSYRVDLLMLRESDHVWRIATAARSRYRALLRGQFTERLQAAAFDPIHWHMPDTSGYYQPLVVAHRI